MFRIDARCDMTSLNIRKEKHGDERVLAADLKFMAVVPAETVAELVGAPPKAFLKTWWDSKGEPSFDNIAPLSLTTKLTGTGDGTDSKHRIRLEDSEVVEDRCAIIDKCVAEPIDGHKCNLTFRVAISEPSDELIELAATCLQETVRVIITPDDELPLDHSDAGKADADADGDEISSTTNEAGNVNTGAFPDAVDGRASEDDVPAKIRAAWEEEDRERAAASANG